MQLMLHGKSRTFLLVALFVFPVLVPVQHGVAETRSNHMHGASAHPSPSPQNLYAGFEQRNIKALSQDEFDGLTAGKGIGLALPAELNGYPGPTHVLALSSELLLDDRQLVKTQQLFEEMSEAAIRQGHILIDAERALDRIFADKTATPDDVERLSIAAAEARGKLRAIHLKTHLKQIALLRDDQIKRYKSLRGYQ